MSAIVFKPGQTDYLIWLNKLWNRVSSVAALTDGATITIDLSADERVFDVTLGGNRTLTFINGSASVDGKQLLLRVKQDATGSRSLTMGAGMRLGSDLALVTLSTAPNKTDYLGLVYNSAAGTLDVLALTRGY